MSANQPFSRNDLQQLKAKTEQLKAEAQEQHRLNQINRIVNQIHSTVINQARTQTTTSYSYQIQQHNHVYIGYPYNYSTFCEKNKDDIINGLKRLFPDCSIDYKMLSIERTHLIKFDNKRQNDHEGYIVIDWS